MKVGEYLRGAEAMIALSLARAGLRVLPFRRVAALGGAVRSDGDAPALNPATDPIAVAVSLAIARAAARLPWQSSCLVRAVAAKWMLARRGVPSILIVGVRTRQGLFEAHAWLTAAGGTVCGGAEAGGYQAIAGFRVQGGEARADSS